MTRDIPDSILDEERKKAIPRQFTSTAQGAVPVLRKFHLMRIQDATGISGTGIVAVGVMFPSGVCIMEWTTPIKSVGSYNSVADLEALHGHNGMTKVVFDGEF